MKDPCRILIVRNDKLGDFMLIWPAISLLKQQYPNSTIIALVAGYTEPMASLCPWIDEVLIDPEDGAALSNSFALASLIRASKIDVSISFFSTMRTAFALCYARVPVRLAPATKIAQFLYNKRLKQKRSRSEKPEYIYNVELASHLIKIIGDKVPVTTSPPYLTFDKSEISETRRKFMLDSQIGQENKLIFIHPGSGGSAPALDARQYALLIDKLSLKSGWHFVITAGPGEIDLANSVASKTKTTDITVYQSEDGLVKFSLFLSIADLFISGSTGVLHIAGALDVPTIAFYTRRQSATSLRWQTMNTEGRRMSFSPPESSDAEDMQSIEIEVVADEIMKSSLSKI